MTDERPLGRVPPSDDRHLRRWSLTPETIPTVSTAVVLGMNWYKGFDKAGLKEYGDGVARATYFPPESAWGVVRGGHCVCLKPPALVDLIAWWKWLDQLNEGACVGFGTVRQGMLHNRKRYNGFEVYYAARRIDEWAGENYSGTSVRAGMDVARTVGLPVVRDGVTGPFRESHGISENRWARSVQDIAACLDPATMGQSILGIGYVVMLNSWGAYYPHYVRIPLDMLDRLIFREDGEATVVIDR